MPTLEDLLLRGGDVITEKWYKDHYNIHKTLDDLMLGIAPVLRYGYFYGDLVPYAYGVLDVGKADRVFRNVFALRGYFNDNVWIQGKRALKDEDPIYLADIYPDAQSKITNAINESNIGGLKGTDNRDLSQLYNILKGRQVRAYYHDDFTRDDTWFWDTRREGTVSDGVLTLSNNQARRSSRPVLDYGCVFHTRMMWGVTLQTGVLRYVGWGFYGSRVALGFLMRDTSFLAYYVWGNKFIEIDITSSLPSDYDSAFHSYNVVVDKGVARFFINASLVAEIELPGMSIYYFPKYAFELRNSDTIAGDMKFDYLTIAYFTPREDFVPTNQIIKSFAGSVGGGTGYTTSWSYTVPEGKRAIIEVAEALSDDDTTDGVFASVEVDVGGTRLHLVQAGMHDGVACGTKDIKTGRILLLPGQTVYGTYQNASTSSHYLSCRAVITELE